MSLSQSNLSYNKIDVFNFLNENYTEVISQLNIIVIHFDQLQDIVNSNYSQNSNNNKLNFRDKHVQINSLITNLKQTYQSHYLKLNECLKSIDKMSSSFQNNNIPVTKKDKGLKIISSSTNEEETNKLNSQFKTIFKDFNRLDKVSNDLNKIKETKNEEKINRLKTFESRMNIFIDEIRTLDFNEMNSKLVNLEVDNLFGEANMKDLEEDEEMSEFVNSLLV